MTTVHWNYTPPSGVSLREHIQILPLKMLEAYATFADVGCVFVVSYEVAAVLEHTECFNDVGPRPGPVTMIGSVGGIQVWVNADIIVVNEVLVVDRPEDLHPKARVVIEGMVPEETALDYLSRL